MDIQAPAIQTTDALTRTFENMWRVFQKNEPEYCKQFLEFVKQRRGSLVHSNGMSQDGHFMAFAEIPPRIFWMMVFLFGNNWTDNPKVATPFYRVFEQFRINQSRAPNFNTARDFEPKESVWNETVSELAAS